MTVTLTLTKAAGVDRSRILIKLAGTWEGIAAARILTLTLIPNPNLTLTPTLT